MNPFTKSLAAQLRDRALQRFVSRWDALEALVVRVYRAEAASEADEREWQELRPLLRTEIRQWSAALGPYWHGRKIGGQPARSDPFAALIVPDLASDFVANRRMMQTLPAAREALNLLLLAEARRAA